jgi:Glycosyl hydrolase family 12/LysM domain
MTPPLRALAAAGLLLAASVGTVAVAAGGVAYADTQICDKYGTTTVQNRYVVMNNVWGADTTQCINATNSGFTVTTANHHKPTNGGPASYAAIYLGCYYTNCSPGTNLPMQVGQIRSATSSVSYSYPGSGVYNAAYDVWLDPTSKETGENKQELMVWFDRQGPIRPYGSRTGSASIGGRTWEVWSGSAAYRNVVSYFPSSPIESWNFSILDFINDVRTRSAVTDSWYLTSIQAGFEAWVGGTGLAVNSFTASVNGDGGGGSTPAQPVPPTQPAPASPAAPPPASPSTPAPPTASPTPPTAPAARSYVVQPGDTLWDIAARQHVKGGWKSLYKRNRGITGPDPNLILPGQRLSL